MYRYALKASTNWRRSWGGSTLPTILRAPMERGLAEIQAGAAGIPAARPNSTYVRGGPKSEKLGSRWTHRIYTQPDGIYGVVGNNASYAPFVQNYQFQAGVHRRRWLTDKGAVEKYKSGIVADFQRVINRALE
jgi:hypothetical protein